MKQYEVIVRCHKANTLFLSVPTRSQPRCFYVPFLLFQLIYQYSSELKQSLEQPIVYNPELKHIVRG